MVGTEARNSAQHRIGEQRLGAVVAILQSDERRAQARTNEDGAAERARAFLAMIVTAVGFVSLMAGTSGRDTRTSKPRARA